VLLQGLGVENDAHCGVTVKHRSRVRQDPSQPNLRQVHLIHGELFDELKAKGFSAAPGQLGENITTRGLDLLAMPTGTELRFGAAVVRLTGLRNPCSQLDAFQAGLMSALIETRPDGTLARKAGVMGVVAGGRPGSPGRRDPRRPPATAAPRARAGVVSFRMTTVFLALAALLAPAAPTTIPTRTVHEASGIAFVLIPAGEFMMGSAEDEWEHEKNEHRHKSVIAKPFFLGETEVTVGQFRKFVEATGYVTDAERGVDEGGHGKGAYATTPDGGREWSAAASWRNPFPNLPT
jgi:hypothetical protein